VQQLGNVLIDKGSKYAVSGSPAHSKGDVGRFLRQLKTNKKYAKATHNSWAMITKNGDRLKNDDGETGAGMIILNVLEQQKITDHVIVVTRWYGGVHLGGDRFRHVLSCAKTYINHFKLA